MLTLKFITQITFYKIGSNVVNSNNVYFVIASVKHYFKFANLLLLTIRRNPNLHQGFVSIDL